MVIYGYVYAFFNDNYSISITDSLSNKRTNCKSNARGNTTTYTYDIHGNLIKESVGYESIGYEAVTYTYDKNKNLLTMTDVTGSTIRTYDELGRVTSKTVPNVGCITYDYDITDTLDIIDLEGAGLELEAGSSIEKSRDPKGNISHKLYDKVGRLSKVIVGEDIITYTYYDNGNRKSITYNDGSKEEYAYYANNQIRSLINKRADGSIMDSYHYSYDNAGNQLTKYESIDGYEKGTTSYSYDFLNRLETVTEPDGRVTTYTYDKAGNREIETIEVIEGIAGVGGFTTITTINTYMYNKQNQLTEITTKVDNVITEVTSYTYDNNGNQLKIKVATNENDVESSSVTTVTNIYNFRNQLIQTITSDGTMINNTYNAEGYRTIKEVDVKENFFSVFKPFGHVLDKENLYNFLINPKTTDKELEVYATNLWAAGLTVYGFGKTAGIKSSSTSINISKIVPSTSGTLQLAGSATISVPTLGIDSFSMSGIFNVAAGTLGVSDGSDSNEGAPKTVNDLPIEDKITGYTKHGTEQALGRDGGIGVSNKAITDAVNNPVKSPISQSGGTTKYIGKDATVVLNQDGKVVTTWANSSAGPR